jgi:hypothetical protein
MSGVRVLPAVRQRIVIVGWFVGALIARTIIASQFGVL